MKTPKFILSAAVFGLIALLPKVASAVDGDATHDFQALNLDINGNTMLFGSLTGTPPTDFGLEMIYVDSTLTWAPSQLIWRMNRENSEWIWGRVNSSDTDPAMILDAGNALSLYSLSEPNNPVIVLDPEAGAIFIGDRMVLSSTSTDATRPVLDVISLATGGSTASGSGSTAMGSSEASNAYATALGSSTASGEYSTALGHSTAIGFQSTALGSSTAGGEQSTAIGYSSSAIGDYSFAMGTSTAQEDYSTAIGIANYTLGLCSTAIGSSNIAIGSYSTAMGYFTTAQGYNQFVIGQFNILQGDGGTWNPTDELFTIGNGTDLEHPSNALVVLKNGDATFQGVVRVKKGGDIPMFEP
jgi:hypothetical protein